MAVSINQKINAMISKDYNSLIAPLYSSTDNEMKQTLRKLFKERAKAEAIKLTLTDLEKSQLKALINNHYSSN